jgi:outer membrane protein TolC
MKAHILLFLFIFVLLSFQLFASEPDSSTLSLSEAVEIALSNNLNLKIERISPEIQKNNLESAKSIFDPHLNFSAALSDKKTLPKRAETETFQANIEAGISKKLDYGTNVAVSCMIIDSNEETSLADQDSKSASGSLVISQPLLKNRGKTVNHRNIIVSENNLKKSNLDLKQAIINMVVQTQYLYWQVYSAKESLVVQKESLQLAQRFLEEVNMKIKVGGGSKPGCFTSKS